MYNGEQQAGLALLSRQAEKRHVTAVGIHTGLHQQD
jgi:hypothetical protein